MAIPYPRIWAPVTIGASNNAFQVAEQANAYTSKTLTSGTYYSPNALAAELVARCNDVLGSPDVSYSIDKLTGRITLSRSSGQWKVDFNVPNSCGTEVGFGTSTNQSATSYTGTLQPKNGWWPAVAIEREEAPEEHRAGGFSASINGVAKGIEWGRHTSRRFVFSWLEPHKVYVAREGANTYEALQRIFRSHWDRFRYWPDGTVDGAHYDLALDRDAFRAFRPKRQLRWPELYTVTLEARDFVS